MNPMNILFVAIALASSSAMISAASENQSSQCTLQSEKPVFEDEAVVESDDFEAKFAKMFRAYVTKEQDGKTLYLPLNLTSMGSFDYGESTVHPWKPHKMDTTLTTDCSVIELGLTKRGLEKEIVYRFNKMTYNYGDQVESCKLVKKRGKEDVIHTYNCFNTAEGPTKDKQISTLIIQRMDLEKFAFHDLTSDYKIIWQ